VWHAYVAKQKSKHTGHPMGYRIRQIEPASQFCDEVTVEVITDHVPIEAIEEVIENSTLSIW
jgi:hypothetical protein